MKISMLDISTAHVSEQTAGWLDELLTKSESPISIYGKGEYGWFINVHTVDDMERENKIPEDLRLVMDFARKRLCSWIMFDRDAETINKLPKFVW